MSLLELLVDIWTSYVVPLVQCSDMVRLAAGSRASGDLAYLALRHAPDIVLVAPSDLNTCLTWLRNRSICIDQLIIENCNTLALETTKRPEYSACFREIALKFSNESSNATGVYDNDVLLLLHRKLAVLQIEAPSFVPARLMGHGLGYQNLHSITWHVSRRCSQAWLVQLIQASPRLRKLNMFKPSSFTNDVFAAMAERKDTLTELAMWVNHCDESERIAHDQLRRLLQSCPSLRKLTFQTESRPKACGDALVGMAGKCSHLEELVFHRMKFSGGSLLSFVLSCPKLRVCQVGCGYLADQDLDQLRDRGLPKLQCFGLGWAVEQLETVVACASLFEEVRTYHMHCSEHWRPAAEALAFMPHLDTVYLYSHPASMPRYLGRHCPHLRVLRLVHDVPAAAGGLRNALITALPRLPELEELQWGTKCGFGDAGLNALAQHCPNLRTLDCKCANVTDVGLIGLVRSCPALRTLLVWGCENGRVTNAFLRAIAQHCPYLEELRLPVWGPKKAHFSHAAVNKVIAACIRLRELHIRRMSWAAEALVVPAGRLRRLTIDMQIL